MNVEKAITSNFSKQLVYYLGFYFIIWSVNLVLVSSSAFFHFLLDHRIAEIEEWIFDRSWLLISSSKIIAVFVVIKFINLKKNQFKKHFSYNHISFSSIEESILSVSLFLLIFFIFLSMPISMSPTGINLFKFITSIFGVIIYYTTDMLIFLLLSRDYCLSNRKKVIGLFLFPTFFIIFNNMIFVHLFEMKFITYFIVFTVYYIVLYIKNGFTNALIFLLLFVVPVNSILGLDPVWRKYYSPLITNGGDVKTFIVICFIAFMYIFIKNNDLKHVFKYLRIKLERIKNNYSRG